MDQGDTISIAVRWVLDLMLGSVATSLATVAVALFGLMMFNGTIDRRRALSIVIGCFILFGAQSLAIGIRGQLGDATLVRAEIADAVYDDSRAGSTYDPYDSTAPAYPSAKE
jgi:type IV secretory pathway VirB2 component (pilin)